MFYRTPLLPDNFSAIHVSGPWHLCLVALRVWLVLDENAASCRRVCYFSVYRTKVDGNETTAGPLCRMLTLSWDEAVKKLRAIDPELAAAFDCVYEAAPPARRPAMTTELASYKYGDEIIRQGTPLSDDGSPVSTDLTLPTKLPLGIILRNGAEVVEAVVGRDRVNAEFQTRLMPQALLGPKRLIGVFELLDWKITNFLPDNVDWNITAGSRTLYATKRHRTRSVEAQLRRVLDVPAAAPLDHPNLYDWLSEIPIFKNEIKPGWHTDILYFSHEWFREDTRANGLFDQKYATAAQALYHQLLERAWPTLSRLRPNSGMLYDVLRDSNQHSKPREIEAAFQILEHTTAIRKAARPCFSPTRENDTMGPFGVVVERIINPILECTSLLRPTYLINGQSVGYLKLGHIAPAVFTSQIRKSLGQAMRNIVTATNHARKLDNRFAGRALGWPNLFNDLMFRVPSNDSEKSKPLIVRYKAQPTVTVHGIAGYDDEYCEEESFFSLYDNNDLPSSRCEFFTGSVRIEISDDK
jgi:hypothetical protein